MPISANELRNARRRESLTQSELAKRLNVSPRTVVNWERDGAFVPRRVELQVEEVLGAALDVERDRSSEQPRKPASDLEDDPLVADVTRQIAAGSKRALYRMQADRDETAKLLASTLIGARDAIKFADAASRAGAHPETVLKIVESAVAAVIETGAGAIPGEPTRIFIEDVMKASSAASNNAVKNFVPDTVDKFDYTQEDLRRELFEKIEKASSIGTGVLSSDEDSEADADKVPEDLEEEWGLAAHPKTDLPKDHTP